MRRLLNGVVHVLLYIPITALVAMMCIEVGNIIGRPWGKPIQGSIEMTSYLGGVFISLCVFYTTLRRANIVVGLIVSQLSSHLRSLLEIIVAVIGIATVVLLIWAGAGEAWNMTLQGETSLLLNLPIPVVRFCFVFALMLAGIVLIANLYSAARKVIKK